MRHDTRMLRLTDKGRSAVGAPAAPVWVPLLKVRWRDDALDRREGDADG